MSPLTGLSLLILLHGGQYLPPADAEVVVPELEGVVSQPGLGPVRPFEADRWEWWFDFNQEAFLDLRRRLPARAAQTSTPFAPVTDDDRRQRALPALVDALRQHARDVRAAAALSLARLRLPQAIPYVELAALEDPDLFVRTQALLGLGVTGSGQVVELLASIYEDASRGDEERSYAAFALGLLGNDHAIEVLRRRLDEESLGRQSNALRAATLFAAGLTEASVLSGEIQTLLDSWLGRQEPHLRGLAAVALGRIGDEAALPTLRALLEDAHNQVRRSAAVALAAYGRPLGDETTALMLERLEQDGDLPVRLALMRALGAARAPRARDALRELLSAATHQERSFAALSLAIDGHPDNTLALLAALEDEHELSVLGSYAVALGVLGNVHAAPALRALGEEHAAPSLRGYVALGLGLMGARDPRTLALLDEILERSHDVEARRWSIVALGLLGARERVEALAEKPFPPDGSVIDHATRVHGLGLVGDRHTLERLLEVLADESLPAYVRTYAAQAIGELCDPRPMPPAWRLSRDVNMSHDVGFLREVYSVL